MKQQLAHQLNRLSVVSLSLVALIIPLIFTNVTTEYFETAKVLFLLVIVSILLLLRGFIWILEGKVIVTKTPLDIPLMLFFLVILLSGVFSPLHQVSFIGNIPELKGTVFTWFIYVLLYFLATSSLRGLKQVQLVFYAFILSGVIAATVSLLSYFDVYLPFNFAKVNNFDLTGSSFSSTALISLVLPIVLLTLSSANKLLAQPVALVISSLFAVDIALTGTEATILTAILGFLLAAYVERRVWVKSWQDAKALTKVTLATIPLLIGLLVVLVSLIPLKHNLLHQKEQTFNREIQLGLGTSWQVSAGSFRDSPFLGSGPETYPFDFNLYKPVSLNTTPYWQLQFNSAANEFLQTLATLGGLGSLTLIFICVVILTLSWKGIRERQENNLVAALSISAILIVALLILHSITVVTISASLLILAMLMSVHKATTGQVEEFAIGIKASSVTGSNLITGDILPTIVFIIFLLFVLFIFFNPFGQNAIRLISADIHHRAALNDAQTNGVQTYQELVKAESLNPESDLYRQDIAIANFNLANALVSAKLQSASSPSAALSDTDKQTVQQLLGQSIDEGRAAVAINPLNVKNWEILASIYHQISGVAQNSLQFSLDSYGHAIARDPFDPILRLDVGGIYYSIKNYDMAVRFFTDAVNLKTDYANGYYNLSIALHDKGDLTDASLVAQKVLSLLDPKSQDYQVASSYLQNLEKEAKAQSSSTANVAGVESANTTPPAAQEHSSLQRKDLPKVLSLPSPSTVSTPSAVPAGKP